MSNHVPLRYGVRNSSSLSRMNVTLSKMFTSADCVSSSRIVSISSFFTPMIMTFWINLLLFKTSSTQPPQLKMPPKRGGCMSG